MANVPNKISCLMTISLITKPQAGLQTSIVDYKIVRLTTCNKVSGLLKTIDYSL